MTRLDKLGKIIILVVLMAVFITGVYSIGSPVYVMDDNSNREVQSSSDNDRTIGAGETNGSKGNVYEPRRSIGVGTTHGYSGNTIRGGR